MSRLLLALLASAGLGVAATAAAQMTTTTPAMAPLTQEGLRTAKKEAVAQYDIDKGACGSLSGNTKDICMAEAKGKENIARAEAEAAFKSTPKTRENVRLAFAQSGYDVAIQKCDELAGNTKDVCVKEAKAGLVRGKAEAKVDRVAADTRKDGAEKRTEARTEATEATREADYKVAVEKCDALSGSAKDGCVSGAKAQFGKS